MDVTVRHHAPVRYRSRVTRGEREGLYPMETPVRIPRLGKGDAEWRGCTPGTHDDESGWNIYRCEDGIFAPLRRTYGQDHKRGPVPESEFVEALAKGMSFLDFDTRAILATPLNPWHEDLDACMAVSPGSARDLVHDGRPRAAADLTAYVARSLRLHRGLVLHRLRGPYLAVVKDGILDPAYAYVWDIGRLAAASAPRRRFPLIDLWGVMDDYDDLLKVHGMAPPRERYGDPFPTSPKPWPGKRPDAPLDDLAVLLALGWGRDATREGSVAGPNPALAALARTLRLGCPRPEETDAVIRAVHAVATDVARVPSQMQRRAAGLARYLEVYALPKLAAAPPAVLPEDDAESLGGLAP